MAGSSVTAFFLSMRTAAIGAKRHKLRVIKQKPRTVFSARFVCSGLPLAKPNENDFLLFQKRKPNSLQPAK